MINAYVIFGIGIEITINDLLNSVNEINSELLLKELLSYNILNEINEHIVELVDEKESVEQMREILKPYWDEKVVLFRTNICEEDIVRMNNTKQLHLFDLEKQFKPKLEMLKKKGKELGLKNYSAKVFLYFEHSY